MYCIKKIKNKALTFIVYGGDNTVRVFGVSSDTLHVCDYIVCGDRLRVYVCVGGEGVRAEGCNVATDG